MRSVRGANTVAPFLGTLTMWYREWEKGAYWKLPSMCQPVRPTWVHLEGRMAKLDKVVTSRICLTVH